MFNSAIDYAIIVMGLDGRVDDWNEGATRILGWSPAEMVERPADVFFTPEDRANGIAAKEMRAALEHGRGVDERWHLRKDGTRFWANGEMMALRDEAGQRSASSRSCATAPNSATPPHASRKARLSCAACSIPPPIASRYSTSTPGSGS